MIKQVLSIVLLLVVLQAQQPDTYDAKLSNNILYYSKAAYCSKDSLQSWTCDSCDFHPSMTDVKVITNLLHESQMYMGFDQEQNNIVMSFRGSHNIMNWVTNLDFKKKTYPACNGCEVHAGFYKAWEAIKDEVLGYYKSLIFDHPGAKLVITGHSLGATQAQLAALSCVQANITVDEIYVYGPPRIGNKEFAEYGTQALPQLKEVTHYRDPVPHLPLQTQGFIRIPTEVFYYDKHDDSKWQWCPSAGGEEDESCCDKFSVATNIEDHLHYLGHYTGCGEKGSQYEDIQAQMFNSIYQMNDSRPYSVTPKSELIE